MAANSEHQGLQIAVIIFALLTIIMSGATFYVFKLSEDAELRAAEAVRTSQNSDKGLQEAIKEIEELRRIMGTEFVALNSIPIDPNDPEKHTKAARDIFNAHMTLYANTFPAEK